MNMFDRLAKAAGVTPTTAPAAPQQPAPTTAAPNGNTQPQQQVTAFQHSTVASPEQPVNTEKSPLDQYKDLFQTKPTEPDPNNPAGVTKQQADNGYVYVDPKVLQEKINEMNFLPAGEQHKELLTAAQSGDASAVMKLMNATMQNGYMQQTQLVQQLLNKVAKQVEDNIYGELPTRVRDVTANQNLRSKNPAYNHPGLEPLLSALQSQFSKKFPNATAEELQDMTVSYLKDSSSFFAEPKEEGGQTQQQQAQQTDWGKLINGGSPFNL